MDAVKFLEEKLRMCKYYKAKHPIGYCEYCDLENYCGTEIHCPDDAVECVETWSKIHPLITNAKKFEEIFGVNPKSIFPLEWWDEVYKEPDTQVKEVENDMF